MSFLNGREGPAAADERRANELEVCRKCKKAVDGFTWDRLGGYCPACARTEDKRKDKNRHRSFGKTVTTTIAGDLLG